MNGNVVLLLFVFGAYLLMNIAAKTDVIEKMATAIRDWESGGSTSALSYRNNNPGNLKFAGQLGAIGQDNQGHAIFDSYMSGWNALIRQLNYAFLGTSSVYSPSMTLYEFFSRYAEANSIQYAEFVAGRLGVAPTTKLSDLKA